MMREKIAPSGPRREPVFVTAQPLLSSALCLGAAHTETFPALSQNWPEAQSAVLLHVLAQVPV